VGPELNLKIMKKRSVKKNISGLPKIGVAGVGFVGGAVRNYFEKEGYPVFVYDKYKKLGSIEELNEAEWIFICVPTPYKAKKGFDLSAVKEAVGILLGKKNVVIKSTVVPGTTESLQKEYPQHKFIFYPEFLREATAHQDFVCPDRQILGVTGRSREEAKDLLEMLPLAPYSDILSSTQAEIVKYIGNSFLALKVVFANEIYELCRKMGIDYEPVKTAVGHDKRITHSHLNVSQDGYRGYGGRCFPKDVNAFIQFAERSGADLVLLKAMRKINRGFLKRSGLTEQSFLK